MFLILILYRGIIRNKRRNIHYYKLFIKKTIVIIIDYSIYYLLLSTQNTIVSQDNYICYFVLLNDYD